MHNNFLGSFPFSHPPKKSRITTRVVLREHLAKHGVKLFAEIQLEQKGSWEARVFSSEAGIHLLLVFF